MLVVFDADESLFHTGWFIESLATQTLVIFVIRTTANPLRSRPSLWLTLTTLSSVMVAIVLPFTPIGHGLGFEQPSIGFFVFLAGVVVVYLLLAQGAKQLFYRRWAAKQVRATKRERVGARPSAE
jgi:Mg2+-importing ATPase